MSGRDRRGKKGCRVPANASSSYRPMDTRDGLEGAVNLVGELGGRTTLEARYGDPSPRSTPTKRAGGLLIYRKHRGVLNVEEFRRTNQRHP